ncbi:MAG: LytR C-terminal domain-containing protein [Ignavibacteria bacterium]|nr:LytR C-terminal domain-containing protein [Ignavibacteria bacterium]
MRVEEKRKIWPWVVIGVLGTVVLVFLGSLVWRMVNPPIVPYVELEGPRSVIQLTISNSSGVTGVARKTLNYLRERGFDVVELSTAPDTVKLSRVIDRVGDRISAMKVAKVLGISDTLVVSDIDSMLFVRVSVILGSDVKTLSPFDD